MKTTKGICISLLALGLLMGGFYLYTTRQDAAKLPQPEKKNVVVIDEASEKITQTMDEASPKGYHILVEDGFLTIYDLQGDIYGYTDIEYAALNEELQKEIIQGMYFKSQKELYDFLENYSS